MKQQINALNMFFIIILSISAAVMLVDIFDTSQYYHYYLKLIVFCTACLTTGYYFFRKSLNNTLTFTIITCLFNPFYPVIIDHKIWRILEFPVLFLFIHKIYLFSISTEIKKAHEMAFLLDEYFKELEQSISYLSYPQICLYVHKKYPLSFQIKENSIIWKVESIPSVRFEVTTEFYSLGKNSKGGVTATCLNQYKSIELHQNFNLTGKVKNTIIENKTSNATRQGKFLKKILITKYHFLELS